MKRTVIKTPLKVQKTIKVDEKIYKCLVKYAQRKKMKIRLALESILVEWFTP